MSEHKQRKYPIRAWHIFLIQVALMLSFFIYPELYGFRGTNYGRVSDLGTGSVFVMFLVGIPCWAYYHKRKKGRRSAVESWFIAFVVILLIQILVHYPRY